MVAPIEPTHLVCILMSGSELSILIAMFKGSEEEYQWYKEHNLPEPTLCRFNQPVTECAVTIFPITEYKEKVLT